MSKFTVLVHDDVNMEYQLETAIEVFDLAVSSEDSVTVYRDGERDDPLPHEAWTDWLARHRD